MGKGLLLSLEDMNKVASCFNSYVYAISQYATSYYQSGIIEEVFMQAFPYLIDNLDDFEIFILAIKEDLGGDNDRLVLELKRLKQISANEYIKFAKALPNYIEKIQVLKVDSQEESTLCNLCNKLYENAISKYTNDHRKNKIEEIFYCAYTYLNENLDDYYIFAMSIVQATNGNESQLILEMNRLRQIMFNDYVKIAQNTKEEIKKSLEDHTINDNHARLEYYCIWLYYYTIAKYTDGNEKNFINETYEKAFPYLRDNLDQFYTWILAVEDNLNGKSGSLLSMSSMLSGIYAAHCAIIGQELLKKIKSKIAFKGKRINQKKRNDILNELMDFIDDFSKNESSENFDKLGIITEFWEQNKERCIQEGWNKPDSLGRALRKRNNNVKSLTFFETHEMFKGCSIDFDSQIE